MAALWASGVVGVAGSERLGVTGLRGGGTAAGFGLEFGKSRQAH